MSVLGSVAVYIKKGQIITGVAVVGDNNKPVGGAGISELKPSEGDTIIIEFLEIPE
jgi:hypothetical protein